MNNEKEFQKALKNKNVPILVLDQKWHRLFAIHGKTVVIKELEAGLNALLARQGKLNTELRELKRLKNKTMDSIVQNMEGTAEKAHNTVSEKKLEENRRLMDEINEKMEAYEEELMEIPKQIHDTNESLMLESMDYFYEKIRVNQTESLEIEEWIKQVRVDLKKNIIRKQNRDINNREIYAYLHDILGAEVLDLFDIKYEEEVEEEGESQ